MISGLDQYHQLSSQTAEIMPEDAFKVQLQEAYDQKRSLRVKFGADPSRPDLHLGHTVVLRKLRQFQDLGHHVDFVIGDFTALIGDPTGRNKTRPPLDAKTVEGYAKTYQEQVFRILDPKRTTVHFNRTWLDALRPMALIPLLSQVTVQQLLARDDFSTRYRDQVPIFLHECLYAVLQAYDSVYLQSDVECGGTDQKFNLLLAREFQKGANQAPQSVVLMPILEGLDGEKKMSKSLGNTIELMDQPIDMFGKVMSLSDTLMIRYYALLTDRVVDQVASIKADIASGALHPMVAKKQLAHDIVTAFHSLTLANESQAAFEKQFSKREYPTDMPVIKRSGSDLAWLDILLEQKWVGSKKEGRRLLTQGAIKWNRIVQHDVVVPWDGEAGVLQVGKRNYVKIVGQD